MSGRLETDGGTAADPTASYRLGTGTIVGDNPGVREGSSVGISVAVGSGLDASEPEPDAGSLDVGDKNTSPTNLLLPADVPIKTPAIKTSPMATTAIATDVRLSLVGLMWLPCENNS